MLGYYFLLNVFVLSTGGILDGIVEQVSSWIINYGYPAIFAVAFLEMVFPPIPSEVVFPLVGFIAESRGLGLQEAIGMSVAGAIGSTAGAILIYFIAMRVGRPAILRFGKYVRIGEDELQKAESWFRRHGILAVFVARMVPGMREVISIPAGIGGMDLSRFAIFTFAGSLIWSTALTLVGYYVGGAWESVADQISSTFSIVGIAIVAGLAIIVGIMYYVKKGKRDKKSSTV